MYYGKDICKGIVHCYAIIPTFFPVLLSYTFVTFFFYWASMSEPYLIMLKCKPHTVRS